MSKNIVWNVRSDHSYWLMVNCIKASFVEELFIFTQSRKEEKRRGAKRSLRLLYFPSRLCEKCSCKFSLKFIDVTFRQKLFILLVKTAFIVIKLFKDGIKALFWVLICTKKLPYENTVYSIVCSHFILQFFLLPFCKTYKRE